MYLVTFLDVRADRLVSLVLLLRRNGRMTAAALARELEVSTRTVLRDIEALSAAGVPVYAERGRHGGFALLPGFRAELAGLSQDEALALLVAGSRRGARALGLGPALASAMLKVVDALPERYGASAAAGRLLEDGRVWLEVMFQDRRHAEWALWEFASAAEALAPGWLRERLHARAAAIAARYAPPWPGAA